MKKNINSLLTSISLVAMLASCSKDKGVDNDPEEFTEQDRQAITASLAKIAATADSILLTANPVQGLAAMRAIYATDPNVEQVLLAGDELFVKYKKGGFVSWDIAAQLIIPPYGGEANPTALRKGTESQFDPTEFVGNTKACLINQQFKDESRKYSQDLINSLSANFRRNNYEVTLVNGPEANLDFFDTELKNFGAIFLISHGGYDGTNTWITTGEEGTRGGLMTTHLDDWIAGRVMLSSVKEMRNGQFQVVSFYSISNQFINQKYGANVFPNSLLYLTADQSFKATTQLAQAFDAKGAGVIIGWDETNCVGQATGKLLLDAMLGGADVAAAFANLPEQSQIDECSSSSGARLAYYPNNGGAIRLVDTTSTAIVITAPVAGNSYANRVLTLTGRAAGVQSILYGTVELNGVTTALTVTSGLNFSQPLVINNGLNKIKVGCYGLLANGKTAFASKEISVSGAFASLPLFTELRWNTNFSDVDFHLLRPNNDLNALWTINDCFYRNARTSWGAELDVDDTNGYGPEHITIPQVTQNGVYRLFIHYFNNSSAGSTDAFVTVAVRDGALVNFGPYKLTDDGGNNAGDIWEVCTIEFPAGTITPVNKFYNLGSALPKVTLPPKLALHTMLQPN